MNEGTGKNGLTQVEEPDTFPAAEGTRDFWRLATGWSWASGIVCERPVSVLGTGPGVLPDERRKEAGRCGD